jgi:RimJ/RimL family protein N-acetyltransferase
MKRIHTERLCLVPVTPENAEVLWNVLQAPDLRDYQDLPDVGLAHFLRTVATRPNALEKGAFGRFEWLVFFEGDERTPLGWVSLRIGERSPSTAEIGYSVVAQFRDRGIATEAVAALVDEGFARLGLRRMRAYCVPENGSSIAVLRRCGFADDGVMANGATVNGRAVDVLSHLLERDRWESLRHPNRSAIGS